MPVRDLLSAAAGASSPATYVEDVFSTYLYTGTGATQSINNGIDLAGKGGLVWIKDRSNTFSNFLIDTVRGVGNQVYSNLANGQGSTPTGLTNFNSNGFSVGTDASGAVNTSGDTYASWTFRKQSKFFDIVSYTGTGSAHAISHSLGSTAGCIMVKRTDTTGAWAVYHKGANGGTTPQNYYTVLNTTAAQTSSSAWWNNTAPTSTQFTVGTDATVNASGGTYIAYIFADQAGGFGATGTDSAIACGSFTSDASGNATVNLGWEPQYLMFKCVSATESWTVLDVMRGLSQTTSKALCPNLTQVENNFGIVYPTATGFSNYNNGSFPSVSSNYIYIAIRRPMKVPTTGTSVFAPVVQTPSGATTVTTGFPVDLAINTENSKSIANQTWLYSRLIGSTSTGTGGYVWTNKTNFEQTGAYTGLDSNTTIVDNNLNTNQTVTDSCTYWNFKRSPTFMDVVCYAGTGANTTIAHNLTIAPQLILVKNRGLSVDWWVYNTTIGNTKYLVLNTNAIPQTDSTAWNNTTPTSTQFTVGTNARTNGSGYNYEAYLFATCAGVSKVGTYTGNATGQSIACGFGSGGARFILIKRTDSTDDWYVFDSANGLTSSSSPYMTWDTINAQTTGNNGVYTSSGGFTLGATASATVNVNGGTYIFLAIS